MNKKLLFGMTILLVGMGIFIIAGRLPKKELDLKNTTISNEKQGFNNNTNEVIKSTTSVISETNKEKAKVTFVELGSVKCVPCKLMQPVMDEIEREYAGQVKVVFHDVWTPEGQPYAEDYGIQAIPTQVFLDSDGKEFHRHTGYYPKEEIVKILKTQGVE